MRDGHDSGADMVARTPCPGRLLPAILLMLSAPPAVAGPWAQDENAVFLSLSLTTEDSQASIATGRFDPETSSSVYGELGLGHGITAGIELDWGRSSRMGTVFTRYTITDPALPVQVALDGGLAYRAVEGWGGEVLLRVGGSLGRGFGPRSDRWAVLGDGGWASIDGAAYFDGNGTLSIWRSEATLGLHLGDRVRGVFVLKMEDWPASPLAVTARPSIVVTLAEGTSLQGGLVAGLSGSDTWGMSLSLWREF